LSAAISEPAARSKVTARSLFIRLYQRSTKRLLFSFRVEVLRQVSGGDGRVNAIGRHLRPGDPSRR